MVGYEAIAAGVPVLVSRESGLGHLLCEIVTDGERPIPHEVLPVIGDEDEIIGIWADAIYEKLVDPKAAFERAAAVRRQIIEQVSWSAVIDEILQALELRAA
jgi:D-inositol-3-phosphate glycosyltransferase